MIHLDELRRQRRADARLVRRFAEFVGVGDNPLGYKPLSWKVSLVCSDAIKMPPEADRVCCDCPHAKSEFLRRG